MTARSQPSFEQLMETLAAVSTRLSGAAGQAIRAQVEKLAEILAAQGPDAELRARAAGQLEQLVEAIVQLVGASPGVTAQASRGIDLTELAGGLRTFAAYLREPTGAHRAEVEQVVATLRDVAPQPVPLDELRIDGRIEELAVDAARRHGLTGAALRHAVERTRREMQALVRQLERRAQQEASRARTASEAERLVDAVVSTGTPLGHALAGERAAIVQAFRTVELARMAQGLFVFGQWLSTPAGDPVAHVAALRAQLAEALGPPTAGDPARSEAERRADFEREIKVALDQILRAPSPPSA